MLSVVDDLPSGFGSKRRHLVASTTSIVVLSLEIGPETAVSIVNR